MKDSKKEIVKRIEKEMKTRDWGQSDLLRKIIEYKYPNLSYEDINEKVNSAKGNFSAALKKDSKRSIPMDDLYIISKLFELPFDYLWHGTDKKSDFIHFGAKYVAYRDSEEEYKAYISGLEDESSIGYSTDEKGQCLFDYLMQYESINGYRFFERNNHMFFDYSVHGQMMYIDKEGKCQWCLNSDKTNRLSDNIVSTLIKHKDIKTFKGIYFDNCLLNRFAPRTDNSCFDDDFLSALLKYEPFLEIVLKTKEIETNKVECSNINDNKRTFVEPMFFEALEYAMKHQSEHKDALLHLLRFALNYNKSQYNSIKEYLDQNKDYGPSNRDVEIDHNNPRLLRTKNYQLMGNIIRIKGISNYPDVDELIKEVERYAFDMTHIIDKQEKTKEGIKITTPDNPLFLELHDNARDKNVDFIPYKIHSNKEYTEFKYYKSATIKYDDVKNFELIMDFLNKAQQLVPDNAGKVLVHGNLKDAKYMMGGDEIIGLDGWQNCHYGDKYEDRAELLSNISEIYAFGGELLKAHKKIFDVVAKGFNKEEQIKLVDRTIKLLNKKRKDAGDLNRIVSLKDLEGKIELIKDEYLK